jgi:hypothetical protein
MTSPTSPTLSDDAPRFALAWAMLACAVATLTLAYPALTGGFLVSLHSDQYIAGYAFREFAAAALRAGEGFPQWNPYLFGGMPYLDAMHGDIFYPTFLLRMLLPTDVAMTWGMILHLWLAGVAGYALFRAHGLAFWPSLIGGLAYMLSGQVASLVSPGHDGKLFVSALFPVTMLVLRAGLHGRNAAWGALALIVGLGVLSPHPQLLQYLLLAAGAYALFVALFEGGAGAPTRAEGVKRLGVALGAVLLGFAMGTVQYLPVSEYVPWSPRAGGRDYAYATSFSMPPEEFINTILPQFSGIIDNYWGRNLIHFHSEFLGVVVAILAFCALGTNDASRRRWVWFWVGTFVVSALWAMGGYTPFYRLVYALVPGTKFFRAPSIIFFVTSFATAALAAYGAQRIQSQERPWKSLLTGAGFVGVIALLGATGGLTSMFSGLAGEGYYEQMMANRGNVVLGGMIALGMTVLVFSLVTAVRNGRITAAQVLPGLALLIVGDSWRVQRNYWQFSEPAEVVYASDAAIEMIKADSLPGRVLPLALGGQSAPRDPFLAGDALMSHGVRNLIGYHGNELGRYQRLYGKAEGMAGVLNPTFWRLANLRYIYTDVPELPDFFRPALWQRVLGPVTNASGSSVYLYKSIDPNPLAWVVPAIVKRDDDVTFAATADVNFPVTSVAVFDTSSAVTEATLTEAPTPLTTRVAVKSWKPGAISLELDQPAPAGAALVVSENFYPGWTATVDGKPATADRVNLTYIGVPLDAGARTVELTFVSNTYSTGKTVTLIAIALSLLLLAGGAVLDRRARV